MCKYPYGSHKPVKYNPIRCIEAILCLICLAIGIFLVMQIPYMPITFRVILLVTSSAFLVVTIVDFVSKTNMSPIYWSAWTLFSITGAILFFVCVGALFATESKEDIFLLIGEVANGITAFVFLLDALLLLCTLKRIQSEIYPENRLKLSERSTQPSRIQLHDDKSVQMFGRGQSLELVVVQSSEEAEEEEEEEPEQITTERITETRRQIRAGSETVQELEKEHIIEQSVRPRTTTSYGGTFPMGRDALPLPSPEPVPSQSSRLSVTRKKSNSVKPSGSQIITKVPASRLRKGPDDKMYLADGTVLSETELKNGEHGYKDPNGVLYTKDGIPIVPEDTEKRLKLTKETLRQRLSSHKLVFKDDEWFTPDGEKVPEVYQNEDGKWMSEDDMPLLEIQTGGGQVVYESVDGFLYTSEGVPFGYNAYWKRDIYWLTEDRTQGLETKTESELHEQDQRQRDLPKALKDAKSSMIELQETAPSLALRAASSEFSTEESIPGRCHLYLSDGTPLIQVRTASGTLMFETEDGEVYGTDGSLIRPGATPKPDRYLVCRPYSPPRKKPRQTYLGDEKKQSSMSLKDSQLSLRSRDQNTSSRTVAISTRMVPKSQKPASAPSSSEHGEPAQRTCKSAEGSRSNYSTHPCYQSPQQVVHHQYIQKPCGCGKMHIQTVSTTHGVMSPGNCGSCYSGSNQQSCHCQPPQVAQESSLLQKREPSWSGQLAQKASRELSQKSMGDKQPTRLPSLQRPATTPMTCNPKKCQAPCQDRPLSMRQTSTNLPPIVQKESNTSQPSTLQLRQPSRQQSKLQRENSQLPTSILHIREPQERRESQTSDINESMLRSSSLLGSKNSIEQLRSVSQILGRSKASVGSELMIQDVSRQGSNSKQLLHQSLHREPSQQSHHSLVLEMKQSQAEEMQSRAQQRHPPDCYCCSCIDPNCGGPSCTKNNCVCCPSKYQDFERIPLQTISECEVEADPAICVWTGADLQFSSSSERPKSTTDQSLSGNLSSTIAGDCIELCKKEYCTCENEREAESGFGPTSVSRTSWPQPSALPTSESSMKHASQQRMVSQPQIKSKSQMSTSSFRADSSPQGLNKSNNSVLKVKEPSDIQILQSETSRHLRAQSRDLETEIPESSEECSESCPVAQKHVQGCRCCTCMLNKCPGASCTKSDCTCCSCPEQKCFIKNAATIGEWTSALTQAMSSEQYACIPVSGNPCEKCGNKNCSCEKLKTAGSGAVQTSETRMVRANDLPKMKSNLPGSTDDFGKNS